MLPTKRAGQIFPRRCEEYTAHLGEHQAGAFTALWTVHGSNDPVGNGDTAAWHVSAATRTVDGIRIAPPEVLAELHECSNRVAESYPREATALDVEYASLFVKIAGWQHELVMESVDSFVDSLYE